MTAITWPSNPTTGQVYTANNVSWKWDGSTWNRQGGSIATEITEGALALAGTLSEAQESNSTTNLATLKNVRDYVGWESGETTWTGFRTTTDTTPAVGTWRMYAASSPFVRTLDYRPHTKAEADAILHKSAGDSYIQQFQTASIFRQWYAPSVVAVPVDGSTIPIVRATCIVEFGLGTFASATDSTLTMLGSIRSLSARTHDFKNVKGNNNVTMDQTFRNFPRREGPNAPATEYPEDWELNVFAVSRTSVINTNIIGVTGWNASGGKSGHARVQWSIDGGTNWTSGPELTDVYNSNITANLPLLAGYQIRPNHAGPVRIRWQVRRGSGINWWFDRQLAFASVA